MKLALITLRNETMNEKLENLFQFIKNDKFIIVFLSKPDVDKKIELESSMKEKYPKCEILDMRVVIDDVSADEMVAMVFTNTKANRQVFASANTVEDIRILLKLQIVDKKFIYYEN